jgi:hypothetical protein
VRSSDIKGCLAYGRALSCSVGRDGTGRSGVDGELNDCYGPRGTVTYMFWDGVGTYILRSAAKVFGFGRSRHGVFVP